MDWIEKSDGSYILKLDSAYEFSDPAHPDMGWLVEKELHMKFDSKRLGITFPDVNKSNFDPNNKCCRAVWGWKIFKGTPFTGVGQSLYWDANKGKLIGKHLNDVPFFLRAFVPSQEDTLQEFVDQWRARIAVKVD